VGIDEQTGTRVGAYLLGRSIGRGGMGVVYRATHIHLGREVALKVLAPELSGSNEFRERFLRESRLAASLDHPNVVTVYDAGDSEGTLYIAMRYVDGIDLAEFLWRERPLEPGTALALLDQVGAALDAAHGHGLIHRDVKPANVMIASRRCYLTDFGLSKRASATDLSPALTRTGAFLGTVNYVAPEQIQGREIGSGTDIYALGCVLHECLTGFPPFIKDSDVAVMYAHVHDPPPRTTDRRPELPVAIDQVVATALAKAPQDRYSTCAELLATARKALLDGARTMPAPTDRPPVQPHWSPRQRVATTKASRTGDDPRFPGPISVIDPRDDHVTSTDAVTVGVTEPAGALTLDRSARNIRRNEPFPQRRADRPEPHRGLTADTTARPHPVQDGTVVTSLTDRGAARHASALITAERRREPAADPAPSPPARGRRRVALMGAVGAIALVALVVALASSGGSPTRRRSTARSGPLTISYEAPWRATSGSSPGSFVLSSAPSPAFLSLVSGQARLAAGVLSHSAPVPGGPPPELVARYGPAIAAAAVPVAGHPARRYGWNRSGEDLVAYVIPTAGSDLAIICAAATSDTAALHTCTSLASAVAISGVQLLPPGPDAKVVAAVDSNLQPVAVARDHLADLGASPLSSRSATAVRVAHVEHGALTALRRLTPPQRYRQAVTALTDALSSEAAGFASLGSAAHGNHRAAYGLTRTQVVTASRRLRAAAIALINLGFAPPPLRALELPGLPPPPPSKPAGPTTPTATTTPSPGVSTSSPTVSTQSPGQTSPGTSTGSTGTSAGSPGTPTTSPGTTTATPLGETTKPPSHHSGTPPVVAAKPLG